MKHTHLIALGTGVLLITTGCASHPKTAGSTTTTLPSTTGTPVIVTSPSAPTTLPSTTGTPVVVTSPAPAASVAGGGAVHHTITGEVTDVDRNSGRVNIRASDGAKVEVILPPLAVATTNKGDRASMDVIIGPAR